MTGAIHRMHDGAGVHVDTEMVLGSVVEPGLGIDCPGEMIMQIAPFRHVTEEGVQRERTAGTSFFQRLGSARFLDRRQHPRAACLRLSTPGL